MGPSKSVVAAFKLRIDRDKLGGDEMQPRGAETNP
jgi:hypothetical protein